MKRFGYRVVVEWSAEDGVFVARVPALPGCAAHGSTADKAAREATVAARGILESLREHGEPVPPEDVTADYSGQVRLRMPRSLHERLARLATAEGVSLNQMMLTLLSSESGKRAAARVTPRKARSSRRVG